jgi:hypothetical protein
MKKQLVIIGIIALLVCVGLSGCSEQNNTNTNAYSDSVQVSNVNVVTTWGWGTSAGQKSGFYHGYPDGSLPDYELTGYVKNIADKPIDSIKLQATFKDASGNVLATDTAYVSSLYIGDSKSFKISVSEMNEPYFDHITDYELEIVSVDFH